MLVSNVTVIVVFGAYDSNLFTVIYIHSMETLKEINLQLSNVLIMPMVTKLKIRKTSNCRTFVYGRMT